MAPWIHNPTCGCAECGNYGQVTTGTWIHNPTCGCDKCGNYGQSSRVRNTVNLSTPGEATSISVPIEDARSAKVSIDSSASLSDPQTKLTLREQNEALQRENEELRKRIEQLEAK